MTQHNYTKFNFNVHKQSFVGILSHSFVYDLLSMAAFTLHQLSPSTSRMVGNVYSIYYLVLYSKSLSNPSLHILFLLLLSSLSIHASTPRVCSIPIYKKCHFTSWKIFCSKYSILICRVISCIGICCFTI